jgi:hypothetical protein
LLRQVEPAFGMFWSAPLETQLLAPLVMRHRWLFGMLRVTARKQGSGDSRDLEDQHGIDGTNERAIPRADKLDF